LAVPGFTLWASRLVDSAGDRPPPRTGAFAGEAKSDSAARAHSKLETLERGTDGYLRWAMDIRSLAAGLSFRGEVAGRRQRYYVFEGRKSFFVFSFSRTKPKSGYFNMVDSEAVTYVQRLARGEQGVTAQSLYKRSRTPKHVGSALEALNILYVLVATGDAKIDHRHKTGQLFFNVSD
jgi:hypothetical protein